MVEGRKVESYEAAELLAEWERSGERMSEWCASRGLNWYSLCAYKGWRQRAGSSSSLQLAEVVLEPPVSAPALYRVLLGEVAIEVADDFRADTLRRLLRVVAAC